MKYKNCRKCGHPNPMENRYCAECGTVFKNMMIKKVIIENDDGKEKATSDNSFKKNYKTICFCSILVLAILLSFIMCTSHTHNWIAATCAQPKTCIECGETEGVSLEHDWLTADCTTPKTCEICGQTEGVALEHKWVAADCITPKTCETCGKTEGNALDHTWLDATYYSPSTCAVCGKTEGKSLGYSLTWYPASITSNEMGSSSDVNIGTWTDTMGNTYTNSIKFWVMESYGMSDTEYIEYVLNESYNELVLTIAAEEGSTADTSSKILVYADSELIYESEWVGNNTLPIETTLNINDYRQFRIVCTTDSQRSCYCIVTALLFK